MKIFENGVPRKTFEPKRVEVTADWVILQSEELHGVLLTKHHAGYQIKKKMGGACGTFGG